MGIISIAVTTGIYKGLAKLLIKAFGGGTIEESIATELAGAAAKVKIEKSIGAIVEQYIGIFEEHREFSGIAANDREAIKLELIDSLEFMLDLDFLAQNGFDADRITKAIQRQPGAKRMARDFAEDSMGLFRQVLEGLVSVILIIRENTKGWKTAEARRVQSRFDELSTAIGAEAQARAKINETLGLIERKVAELGHKEYRDRQDFLDLYLRAIRTTQDSMELFGLEIDPKTQAKEQRLSVAYITLNLREDSTDFSRVAVSWPQLLQQLSAQQRNFLLVRADAGMGKTTLLRWAAIATALPLSEKTAFATVTSGILGLAHILVGSNKRSIYWSRGSARRPARDPE